MFGTRLRERKKRGTHYTSWAERRANGVTHYCAPCVAGLCLSKLASCNLFNLKWKYLPAQDGLWAVFYIYKHTRSVLRAGGDSRWSVWLNKKLQWPPLLTLLLWGMSMSYSGSHCLYCMYLRLVQCLCIILRHIALILLCCSPSELFLFPCLSVLYLHKWRQCTVPCCIY